MFKAIFGGSPQSKILDFLGDHPDYDYSISDIAEYAEVSRPTLYKVIPDLMKKQLIVETREVGKSRMYKLNTKNEIVKLILKFDFELASKIAEMGEKDRIIFA